MWIILLLLTSSDFSHYFQQSLFPVIDGFRCWLLPSLVHKILRDGLEVPWHFHLAKLRLVSSLNLPLCSTSCLLIFYNLEMTAPWIIQGKHLGKCPGVESAVIKRGYVCTVSLFSTRCVSIEMPSANCGQLLLPVSTWLLWCSGTDVLVYRPGGPLIHFHLSPGGQPIKTQNRGKGASERLFFFNNRIIFIPATWSTGTICHFCYFAKFSCGFKRQQICLGTHLYTSFYVAILLFDMSHVFLIKPNFPANW